MLQASAWLHVELPTAGGPLRLVDFASAGRAGTPYRSWLTASTPPPPPVSTMFPRDGARVHPGQVLFQWNGSRTRTNLEYRVEIAANPEFSRPWIATPHTPARRVVLDTTTFPPSPGADRWWSLVAKHEISILYTTPTAIRGLMRYGDGWPARHDLGSLRLLGSVGEPINPEAWRWFHQVVGQGRCPIMDTWWQTETGSFMIAPMPCVPLKPGTGTRPLPGIEMDVVNEHGEPVRTGEDGYLVIKKPWPSMLRTLYKNPDLYQEVYWSKIPGCYTTGDSARKDADGYIWIVGRMDDVIKVSGYRLGTAEIESALVSHPAVAEAACIGLPHEIKGNSIKAFVVLRHGYEANHALEEKLREHVGEHLSKVARPDAIKFEEKLPKTRSGKIMRRLLKALELGQPIGDTSTLED